MAKELERLGREVARLADRELARRPPRPVAERLAWLRGARERGRAPSHPARRGLARWAAALSVALAALAALARVGRREEPLHFEIGAAGDKGEPGALMAAPSAEPLPVSFSDGTSLRLTPNARARITSVSEHGARVVVERGNVDLDVVPRPAAEWTVTLGPFDVRVTGTRFDAGWDPIAEVFELAMYEGSVGVSGACLDRTRTAKKGDKLRLSCHKEPSLGDRPLAGPDAAAGSPGEAPARPDDEGGAAPTPADGDGVKAPPPSDVAPHEAPKGDGGLARPAAVAPAPTPPGRGPAAPPSAPSPRASNGGAGEADPGTTSAPAAPTASSAPPSALPPSWQALATAGDYRAALDAVEREGFSSVLASADAADLKRLGDAARLSRSSGRARMAYEELRRRAPGGDMAAAAAFELGRIAFDDARSFSEAKRWFSTYLSERPQGGLAQEALGRLFEAQGRAGDHEAARSTARSYLERYPNGPHAALAREATRP